MSNPFIEVLDEAIEHAKELEPRKGDYLGEDGMIHCGTCGEPREFRNEWPEFLWPRHGKFTVFKRECRCEREERESMERKIRADEEWNTREDIRESCFPYESMKGMTFANDDGKNPGLTKVCRRYAEKFDEFEEMGAGLLLYGAVGGGKTYYAAAIANAVIDTGKSAVFTSLSTLAMKMQANYGSEKLRILNDLGAYDLVVLDDLGVERGTETMNENVYQVINALYASKTVVIITTNMDAEAMQAETSPNLQRIYSRIFECCQPIEVKSEDRRRTVSDAKAKLYMSLAD